MFKSSESISTSTIDETTIPTVHIQLHTQHLPGEFIDGIYQLYRLIIQMAIQLLLTEPVLNKLSPTDSPQLKRSLLPLLGNALQWLILTATMKDTREIKQQMNQLIKEQTKQETSVHAISLLNVTQYAT